jgi:predicted small secreted protein
MRKTETMKTIVTLIAAAFVLAGCNTVRGIGQDVQKAGEKIEDATRKK